MTIVINDKYKDLKNFIHAIPDSFETSGEVIYDERNKLKAYSIAGKEIVVKSFKIPIFLNRIIYTFFRASKAKRSYKYAFRLLENNILTPEPIAYIEHKRWGLLCKSYYISIYERDTSHVRQVMSGETYDENLIRAVAKLTAEMHSKGIFHRDISPGNILFRIKENQYTFFVIDINRMEFRKSIPEEDRYDSFKRLTCDSRVIDCLGQEYARCAGLDPDKTVRKIKKACGNFFGKEI